MGFLKFGSVGCSIRQDLYRPRPIARPTSQSHHVFEFGDVNRSNIRNPDQIKSNQIELFFSAPKS